MHDDRWQIITNNRSGIFSTATVELRTTEMPKMLVSSIGYKYESCLFTTTDSDVVGRYDTMTEAVAGHTKLCREYGLK